MNVSLHWLLRDPTVTVTCPCSPRTYDTLKYIHSFIIIIIIIIIRIIIKKRGHSTFSQISSNTFSEISSKLQRIIIRFFLHRSRPLYNEHADNIRVHSFYYLKWRHLVNRLPLNNATLKIQHHGVGRRLLHRKDKRCVCGTRGQGQQSILVMRRFFGQGLLHGAAITSGRCRKPLRAVYDNQKHLTWKCYSLSRTWHCDHQTTQIWIWCTIYAVTLGALQEMVYSCRSSKSVQKLTRKLCYRKDDRAMRPIGLHGARKFSWLPDYAHG